MSAPTLNAGVCEGHGCADEVASVNVEAFELTGKVLCESCAEEAFEAEAERADAG